MTNVCSTVVLLLLMVTHRVLGGLGGVAVRVLAFNL